MEISVVAHFAELDENNTVLRVIVIDNSIMLDSNNIEVEAMGIDYCKSLFGENTRWIQTSYHTAHGVHGLNKTPLRKNYAGIGFIYDPARDAFYAPKPAGDYWQFDEDKCTWYDPNQTPVEIGVTRI